MRAALSKARAAFDAVMEVIAEIAPWAVILLFVYSLGYAALKAMGVVR